MGRICLSYAFNLFALFSSLRIIFHRASAANIPTALSFRTLAYNIELSILLSREHLANCTFTTPVLGSRVKTGVARDVLRCCGDLSNWIEIDWEHLSGEGLVREKLDIGLNNRDFGSSVSLDYIIYSSDT